MTAEQVLTYIVLGALGLLAAVVSWAVLRTAEHGNKIATITAAQADLNRRADLCDADRAKMDTVLSNLNTGVAVLVERTFHQTESLKRIESGALTLPQQTSRRSRPASDG